MKTPLFMDFIRPRRHTQVDAKHPSKRQQMPIEDDYVEEISENPEFNDNFDMDYSALSNFADSDLDQYDSAQTFDNPTREEQAKLAESDPSDFVSEPKSFAATILKLSNREKISKKIHPEELNPAAKDDYAEDFYPEAELEEPEETALVRPSRAISSADGFIYSPHSQRHPEARAESIRRSTPEDVSNRIRIDSTSRDIAVSVPKPLTPADEVPLEFKTREELLELAEKQAAAMQNTREARAARAKREADLIAAREAELEQKRIEAEMQRLEKLRLSHQQKYPPRPNFINTNVNKRPLSRSNGPSTTIQTPPPKSVYLSSDNPVPHPLAKPTPQIKKPTFLKTREELAALPPRFTSRTTKSDNFSRSSRADDKTERHSATVIVPAMNSRRSPNLTAFIFLAILAGATIGAAVYLMFLSK